MDKYKDIGICTENSMLLQWLQEVTALVTDNLLLYPRQEACQSPQKSIKISRRNLINSSSRMYPRTIAHLRISAKCISVESSMVIQMVTFILKIQLPEQRLQE